MTHGPAGRFLHICYGYTSDQVEKVVAMFADMLFERSGRGAVRVCGTAGLGIQRLNDWRFV
jgi:NADH:ubiquinone oxidoreductase subunit E